MAQITRGSASSVAFLVTAVSLPVWVIFVCKMIVKFSDNFNPAGVLMWPGFAIIISLPVGWLVGYVVAPLIYRKCVKVGWSRMWYAVFWHAGACIVTWLLYQLALFDSRMQIVAVLPVLFLPMLVVPSLLGTLTYCYRTSGQA